MKAVSFEEYRQQVIEVKAQIKAVIENIEISNDKARMVVFSAMGEVLAEYGVTFVGSQHTLMMLDELATLVLKTEGLRRKAV